MYTSSGAQSEFLLGTSQAKVTVDVFTYSLAPGLVSATELGPSTAHTLKVLCSEGTSTVSGTALTCQVYVPFVSTAAVSVVLTSFWYFADLPVLDKINTSYLRFMSVSGPSHPQSSGSNQEKLKDSPPDFTW